MGTLNRRAFLARQAMVWTGLLWLPKAAGQLVTTRRRQPVAAATPSYLVDEGFEAGTEPSGWSNDGTKVNYNYTAAPILGNKSCYITGGSGYAIGWYPTQTNCWAFCRLKAPGVFTNNPVTELFSIADGSYSLGASLAISNSAVYLRTESGDSAASGSTLLNDGSAAYYVWLHYVSGGTCELYMSTSSTRPASDGSTLGGNVKLTATTASRSVIRLVMFGLDTDKIYDHILVDDAEIGDNP